MRAWDRPSVVHVLWSGEAGGLERVAWDLASLQAAGGRRVGMLFGRGRADVCATTPADGCVEVSTAGFQGGTDLSPRALRRAAAFLRSFDCVHMHAYSAPLVAAVWMCGRPVVCTLHGVMRPRVGISGPVNVRLRTWWFRRADAVVANSEYCRGENARLLGLDPALIRVVANGVRRRVCQGAPPSGVTRLREAGARLLVGVLSRLIDIKRVDRAIEALARVADAPVALAVAGSGPEEAALRLCARDQGVEGRVAFLGHIEDVGAFLSAIDVLVHPGTGEAFGLAVAEAALSGVPVVAFEDGGGVRDVVEEASGVLVRDVPALAALFEEWAASGIPAAHAPEVRKLTAWLSQERFVAAYEALYAEVIDGRGSSG